jgi:hypothetical protein
MRSGGTFLLFLLDVILVAVAAGYLVSAMLCFVVAPGAPVLFRVERTGSGQRTELREGAARDLISIRACQAARSARLGIAPYNSGRLGVFVFRLPSVLLYNQYNWNCRPAPADVLLLIVVLTSRHSLPRCLLASQISYLRRANQTPSPNRSI